MSHQVTAQTEFTDPNLVKEALDDLGWRYTEKDGRFDVQNRHDGAFGIDTNTGMMNKGNDNRRDVGDLTMQYQLVNVRRQAAIEGQTINETEMKQEVGGKRRRYLEITVVK